MSDVEENAVSQELKCKTGDSTTHSALASVSLCSDSSLAFGGQTFTSVLPMYASDASVFNSGLIF